MEVLTGVVLSIISILILGFAIGASVTFLIFDRLMTRLITKMEEYMEKLEKLEDLWNE